MRSDLFGDIGRSEPDAFVLNAFQPLARLSELCSTVVLSYGPSFSRPRSVSSRLRSFRVWPHRWRLQV